MKPKLIVSGLFFAFFAFPITTEAQTSGDAGRKTLWLNGPDVTSATWSKAKLAAQSSGYKFTEINTWDYNNNTTSNDILEWADIFSRKLMNENHGNVLAIGHDAGGIILRLTDKFDNDNISALILDGVPNRGSQALEVLLPSSGTNRSLAQTKLEQLLDLRSQAQNCVLCRILEASKRWFDLFTIPEIRNYYKDLKRDASIIQSASYPDVPYAIIWGNEDEDDELILSRLISSYGNVSTDAYDGAYVTCYRKELDQRIRDIEDQQVISMFRSIATLAGSIANIKIDGSGISLFSLGAVAEGIINSIASNMQANNNVTRESREVAECELIHQALNIWWSIAIAPHSVIRVSFSFPPVFCEYCSLCGNLPQPEQNLCIQECQNHPCNPEDFTFTYYTIEIEPHDGLLSQSEQLLPGAAKTYEAKGCNHFQEQFWNYSPIRNAFDDLFQGFAGTAFVVPK